MPATLTYPGIYVEELPSSTHTIIAAPTSIAVFIGYGHPFQGKGAEDLANWGKPFRVFNFADYTRLFGGFFQSNVLDTNLPDAVYQFFVNGGSDAYVVALEPKLSPGGGAARSAVSAASASVSGIKFTAKQVTDVVPIDITVSNVTNLGTTADIIVRFGSIVEPYLGVKTAGVATSNDDDFISNRLAGSDLVNVAPDSTAAYPTSFSLGGNVESKELSLAAMTPATGNYFNAADYSTVLDPEEALDKVDVFNLLAMPGVFDKALWTKALGYCRKKRAFFIMDPAPNWCADDTYTSVGYNKVEDDITTGQVPNNLPDGALYFPYLKSTDAFGQTTERPPSGFVAGVIARTDAEFGVWKAPAGMNAAVLNTDGVVDWGRMTDMRQGTLNPLGVNVLRAFPGSGAPVVWGARTLATKTDDQFRYLPVRRMALFLEQTLVRNLGWVVFEPNDEPLWAAIRINVESFMLSLYRLHTFRGRTPSEAFAVQCDSSTTRTEDINAGRVNLVVGFCPLKPAEFVVITISQLAGQTS